jgi:hypothetical protein
LSQLSRAEVRSTLPEAMRLSLGKEALRQLAIKLETGGQAAKTLREVRSAQQVSSSLPHQLGTPLKRLSQLAERRALVEMVQDVRLHLEQGNLAEASQKASVHVRELNEMPAGHRAFESPEFRANRIELTKALEQVRDIAQKLRTIESLRTTLEELQVHKADAVAGKLRAIEPAHLPRSVQVHADALRGLAELQQISGQKWTRAPDTVAIRQAVTRIERGLAQVPGTSPQLGKQIQQELAVRAFVEGHPQSYFQLMPKGGPKPHAAQMLRDLKALALGEGTVGTAVGKSALPAEPGAGPASPRAPPGLEPLVPEGARSSWRPPIRESASADLPALEKAAESGASLRKQAQAKLEPEHTSLGGKVGEARIHFEGLQQRLLAPEQQERQRFTEIERQLARRLQAEDRVRIRAWFDENRPVPQIVTALKDELAEAAFLAEVERELERKLTATERALAIKLRKQGRTVPEVMVQLLLGLQ